MKGTESMDQKPDTKIALELDLSGLLCPLPVYKTSTALKKLEAGEVIEVICTDPGSLADFSALARQTGNELIVAEDRGSSQRFLLRKGGS
jgi:tRNA 2-thiouridine synthesizing protein A